MSRLTRNGTVEPVSRDQVLRRERGQGNIHFDFLVQLTTSRIDNLPGPSLLLLLYVMAPGKVANPARGQLNRENAYLLVPVRA